MMMGGGGGVLCRCTAVLGAAAEVMMMMGGGGGVLCRCTAVLGAAEVRAGGGGVFGVNRY